MLIVFWLMCPDVFLSLSHVIEYVLTLLLARYVSDALLLEKYTFICIFQIFTAVLSLYVGRKEGMRLDMKCITTVKTCLAQSSTNPSMQSRMTSVFRKKLFFVNVRINLKRSLSELCFKKRCSIQELMEIVLRLIPTLIVSLTLLTMYTVWLDCLGCLFFSRVNTFELFSSLLIVSNKDHPGIILGVQK